MRVCVALDPMKKRGAPVVTPTSLYRRSFLALPLALMACKPGDSVFEIAGVTMGTTYTVVAQDPSGRLSEGEIRAAIARALDTVNAEMSNWDPASEISRFNAGTDAPTPVSGALDTVMAAAETVHRASEGRFDTTIGPLIELWGFGAPGAGDMPAAAAVEAALARSGHANTLEIGQGVLRKTQPGTQVYLAAIGKGHGADRGGAALETLGIRDYLVEIGGDLYAAGRNPDGLPWQIGIETPSASERGVMGVVGVSGLGLASSGDYRNYFEEDGQRYPHVIDPTTGRPLQHKTASAAVLAASAMLADAWATAMLTLGREHGLAVAEREGIAVLFVERDHAAPTLGFKTVESSRFKALTA